MAWVLTLDALTDLDRMAAEGALRYGFAQSERYEQEIVATLESLASYPQMAPERQAAQSLVRVMPCGSHNILYVIESDDVVILRVLHGLQNWFELL